MTETINYYVALFSRNDRAAYVALAMGCLLVVLALLGLVKGLIRGIGRQGVRTVTVVISAVLAYFATHSMLPLVVDFFEGKTMLEIFTMLKIDSWIASNEKLTELFANMDASTVKEVATLPIAVFVLPVFFALLFILISALMLLVHACVSGILGYTKDRNNFLTRLLGGLLGFAQGVLVAMLIFVPVCGLANVGEEAKARAEEPNVVTAVYDSYFAEVTQSPVHKMITKFGGEKLFKSITSVSVDKKPIDARESVYNILHITEEWKRLDNVDLAQMNEEQRAALTEIVDTLSEDPYTAHATAAVVRTMMKTEVVRESVLEKFDEPFRSFFDEWIEVLSQCTKDTLHEDMDTILDVIIIMSDHGVLESFMAHDADMMKDSLTRIDENGENVISLLTARFNENERTAHLVVTLARLSLTLMVGENDLTLTDETLDTFNNIKSGLNDTLLTIDKSTYGEDTEAYVNDVASALDTTLTANGIELDDAAIEDMAEYISDNNEMISELESMDDTTLTNILIQYYLSHTTTTTP